MAPHKALKKDVKRLLPKSRSSPKIPRRPENQPDYGAPVVKPIPYFIFQKLLKLFVTAFPECLASSTVVEESLNPCVQEVKGHLFNREFERAFGKEEYREAYAIRWSTSRSLGYLQIFQDVFEHLPHYSPLPRESGVDPTADESSQTHDEHPEITNITCLGGGAGAELCALAGLHHIQQLDPEHPVGRHLSITLLDMADWSSVTNSLHTTLTTPPTLSTYASATAKASNHPFVSPESLVTAFHCIDILTPSTAEDTTILNQALSDSKLITLMFTLNELYSTSLPATQKMLLNLTMRAQVGALLLVVDSPGSYSTVRLVDNEKNYPMAWMLDHTLLTLAVAAQATASNGTEEMETTPETEGTSEEVDKSERKRRAGRKGEEVAVWEKLVSEESVWFRLPEDLVYPVELENMRYQMHLYRRL